MQVIPPRNPRCSQRLDATLVEKYGRKTDPGPERKYSPAVRVDASKRAVISHPVIEHVSTSDVDCRNLDMRRGCRIGSDRWNISPRWSIRLRRNPASAGRRRSGSLTPDEDQPRGVARRTRIHAAEKPGSIT